ncbi:MAG: nuclear transport factor 2 family protein [Pseudomonadota bacterium]
MSDVAPIEKRIDEFTRAWNALDMAALAGLWAQDEQNIYYLAEEMDRPFENFEAVQAYWDITRKIIDRIAITVEDVQCKMLSDDIATATFRMHVDASMTGFSQQGFKPIGSDVKVTVILRNTSDGWRFIHYMEAHLGALPFIRQIYNRNVRTEFD